jgi:hypothetical protein
VLVSGTVVDGDLVPVAGATVALSAWLTLGDRPDAPLGLVPLGQTITGEEGRFTVRLRPDPRMRAAFGADGPRFRLEAATQTADGSTGDLRGSRYLSVQPSGEGWMASPAVRLVVRQLEPDPSDPLVTNGGVVDGDGVPVAGATVWVSAVQLTDDAVDESELALLTTRDDGTFTLRLQPDAYVREIVGGNEGRLDLHLTVIAYSDGSPSLFGGRFAQAYLADGAWRMSEEPTVVVHGLPRTSRPSAGAGQ